MAAGGATESGSKGRAPMSRRTSIAVFLLLSFVAAHAGWDYFESRRFFERIDDLRQRGEPVSRNALGRWERPTVDEESRSARYYNAAGELAFRDWVRNGPLRDPAKANAEQDARADLDSVARTGSLAPDAATRLTALRADYSEALEMVDRAAPLGFSKFPPHAFEDYPRTYSLEDLALACSARTVLLAFESDGERAARSLWSCLRLRRALVRSLPPIRSLISEARLVLERTRPSGEWLARIQDAFAENERPDTIERDIRARTALLIESALTELYGVRSDPLVPAAHALWTWRPSLPSRPWIVRKMNASLRRQQEVLAIASRPWPAKLRDLEGLAATSPIPSATDRGMPGLLWYARYLMTTISAPSVATTLTHVRCAQLALAVERFRQEQRQLPGNLSDLVPTYLAAVPLDPFSGGAIIYRTDGDRVLLYGLGRDGKDDGGAVEPITGLAALETKDVGLAIRLRGGSR